MIYNREAHLNERVEKLVAEAKQKNAKGDKRGALFALKKKKLHEKELAKIENMRVIISSDSNLTKRF